MVRFGSTNQLLSLLSSSVESPDCHSEGIPSQSHPIILVKGIPYNIFHFHQGFMTWHCLKYEEAKQLPGDNGGSKILCSPRSRDFRHGSLRYAVYFSSPFVFPYLCMRCMLFLLFAFATSNYIISVPCFNTQLSSKGFCECL